jgi:hypothetical protein
MGALEGTIAQTTDPRHVGILSRVKAGWRRASNRVRAGATAAAVCDRAAAQRIYGVLDGSGQRHQVAKVHSHITKQINNEIVCQLYLDIPTQATTPATQCKRHIATYCTWKHVFGRLTDKRRGTRPNQARHCTTYYPYDFGAHRRSGITNGSSRF